LEGLPSGGTCLDVDGGQRAAQQRRDRFFLTGFRLQPNEQRKLRIGAERRLFRSDDVEQGEFGKTAQDPERLHDEAAADAADQMLQPPGAVGKGIEYRKGAVAEAARIPRLGIDFL